MASSLGRILIILGRPGLKICQMIHILYDGNAAPFVKILSRMYDVNQDKAVRVLNTFNTLRHCEKNTAENFLTHLMATCTSKNKRIRAVVL